MLDFNSLSWQSRCYRTMGSTKLHRVVTHLVAIIALINLVSPSFFIQEGIEMTQISTIHLDNEGVQKK